MYRKGSAGYFLKRKRKLLDQYSGAAAAYSLRSLSKFYYDAVIRARRASDNAERDFTAAEVDSDLFAWSQGLTTPMSYDSSRDVGYFGEVSSTDLISGDDLATELNLTAGTSQNSDAGWLKFYVGPNAFCNRQGNAYILYVAKRSMRYGLSWNDINSAGGVDGTTEVEIDGQSYSVRLMQGADADPSTYTGGDTTCTDNAGGNSEWNELLYRVSEKVPDCADPTEGMEGGESTTRHGGPQNGSNWANFTNSQLNVNSGNGRQSWCQETDGTNSSKGVRRGLRGIADYFTFFKVQAIDSTGWRPCLQINLGQSGDVSAFVTTWYDQSGNDNHATQTTATNQPKIVDAGTLVTENGKAAVDFDGVDDYLENLFISINSSNVIVISVSKTESASENQQIINSLNGFRHQQYNNYLYFAADYYGRVANTNTNQRLLISIFDGSLTGNTQRLKGYQDGIQLSLGNFDGTIQPSLSFTGFSIGRPHLTDVAYMNGTIQELILYPSDQSNNRTAIESNINSYYNIF